MTELDLFHFDEGRDNFERHGNTNGVTFWFARDFMAWLGYDDFAAFEKAITRAIRACTTLGIPLLDTITPIERGGVRDYKLSRFGCYLVAVNGDVKKPQVASAQAYFYTVAEAFQQYLQREDGVERLLIRGDITEREQSLSGVAHAAGVEVFAFFQNEGYKGMYDMPLKRLRQIRGIAQDRSPLDFMGREELAANLFRITQTEAKIKNEGITGQQPLERAAFAVGRTVRQTMRQLSGTVPENLPKSEDMRAVKKSLKEANKGFKKLDKTSPRRKIVEHKPD